MIENFRFLWEIIMMVVYFTSFITIPFMTCFVILDYGTVRLDNVNLIIYMFCWVDIFSNCITGYYDTDKDEIVLDQRLILK